MKPCRCQLKSFKPDNKADTLGSGTCVYQCRLLGSDKEVTKREHTSGPLECKGAKGEKFRTAC